MTKRKDSLDFKIIKELKEIFKNTLIKGEKMRRIITGHNAEENPSLLSTVRQQDH